MICWARISEVTAAIPSAASAHPCVGPQPAGLGDRVEAAAGARRHQPHALRRSGGTGRRPRRTPALIWPSEQQRTASISTSKTLPPAGRGLLQPRQGARRLVAACRAWKSRSRSSCDCFSSSVAAGQLDGRRGRRSRVGREERVDADDRQRAVVLALLVEHRLVLDAAALVAGLHGAEHAAALGRSARTRPAPPPRPGRSARRRCTSPAAGSRCRPGPTRG